MKGFAKEQDEYIPCEARTLPCVTYRRAKPRGESGWKFFENLPSPVAKLFKDDKWHEGQEEFPVYAVLIHRDTGKVIDTVRRKPAERPQV